MLKRKEIIICAFVICALLVIMPMVSAASNIIIKVGGESYTIRYDITPIKCNGKVSIVHINLQVAGQNFHIGATQNGLFVYNTRAPGGCIEINSFDFDKLLRRIGISKKATDTIIKKVSETFAKLIATASTRLSTIPVVMIDPRRIECTYNPQACKSY